MKLLHHFYSTIGVRPFASLVPFCWGWRMARWSGWALSAALLVALAATFSRTEFVLLAMEAVALDANGKGDCPGGSCNSEGWMASLPLRLPSGELTAGGNCSIVRIVRLSDLNEK